jgi:predicted DNA-binding mobile mystery protein A
VSHIAREALERDLALLRARPIPAPSRGWVRAIRDALGMSTRELASRMGLTSSAISKLEANEASGVVSLDTLRRAASALGCRLEYALVPEVPLDEMVRAQALRKAHEVLDPVGHTMALEDQSVDLQHEVEQLARAVAERRGLWS